jgi:hypothetical protein
LLHGGDDFFDTDVGGGEDTPADFVIHGEMIASCGEEEAGEGSRELVAGSQELGARSGSKVGG